MDWRSATTWRDRVLWSAALVVAGVFGYLVASAYDSAALGEPALPPAFRQIGAGGVVGVGPGELAHRLDASGSALYQQATLPPPPAPPLPPPGGSRIVPRPLQRSTAGGGPPQPAAEALCRCVQVGGEAPPLEARAVETGLEVLLTEMRGAMRIFVYPTDDGGACSKGADHSTGNRGYLVEKQIYSRVRASPMRVPEPSDATAFYIPTFTSCWRSAFKDRGAGGAHAAERLSGLVQRVAVEFPYFSALGGRRHFWISTHDMGKPEPACYLSREISSGVVGACSGLSTMLVANSSALVNTADPTESVVPFAFNPRLDVSLVCNGDRELAKAALQRVQTASAPRRYSVFFSGKMEQGYARNVRFLAAQSIRDHTRGHPPGKERAVPAPWGQVLLSEGKLGGKKYIDALADSDLCLAPRGSRVWSPRLFEFVWFGCVPVIIADGYYLPGTCFFDWAKFAIFIPEVDAGRAGPILAEWRREPSRLLKARGELLRLRRRLMWEPGEGDAFELAMLDVYLKQQRKCA